MYESRNKPRRKRYHHFLDCVVEIEFLRKPPLGFIHDESRDIDVFPRDEEGNVLFEIRYWRGMLGNCLHRHFSETILARDRYAMESILIEDVSINIPNPDAKMHRIRMKEQLPVGTRLSVRYSFPEELMSLDEFKQVQEQCGARVGFSPMHSHAGFGRFNVVSVQLVQTTLRSAR